jgi:hypothetical protein
MGWDNLSQWRLQHYEQLLDARTIRIRSAIAKAMPFQMICNM